MLATNFNGKNLPEIRPDPPSPLLSDPKPNMDPEFLAHLVMVLVNKKAFKPSLDAIKDKYYQLFRSQGEAGDEEDDDAA